MWFGDLELGFIRSEPFKCSLLRLIVLACGHLHNSQLLLLGELAEGLQLPMMAE